MYGNTQSSLYHFRFRMARLNARDMSLQMLIVLIGLLLLTRESGAVFVILCELFCKL